MTVCVSHVSMIEDIQVLVISCARIKGDRPAVSNEGGPPWIDPRIDTRALAPENSRTVCLLCVIPRLEVPLASFC